MGFFDRFKKKENKLDQQIKELQQKQQQMPQEQQDAMKKVADDYLAKINAADIGETHKSNTVSGTDAMNAAKTFDSLAGSLGIKTNMTKTMAKNAEFEKPDIIAIKAGFGYNDKNNFIYGPDNNYAPVYYCVETKKAYAPGWSDIVDKIVETGLFDIDGIDSENVPSTMQIEAATYSDDNYSIVIGVAKDYSPVIYCYELKKYIHFSWDDISRKAMNESIDKED